MSKTIKTVNGAGYKNVVITDEGVHYFLSSCNTHDHGYETMAFLFDEKSNKVADWGGSYCEWHSSHKEMALRHQYLCEHLEEVLGQ